MHQIHELVPNIDEEMFQRLMRWSDPAVASVIAGTFIVVMLLSVCYDIFDWEPAFPRDWQLRLWDLVLALVIGLVEIGTLGYFMFATYMWGCGRLYL